VSPEPPRPVSAIQQFLHWEAAGGVTLVVAAAIAIIWANSPIASVYTTLLDLPVVVQVGGVKLGKPLLLWVNDGLMAIFFLLVGLEMKREMLEGELADPRRVVLPGVAAVAGMVVPAAIFLGLNSGPTRAGWAIPMATDIAFALGVLTLVGTRAPASLKIFLLAIAIIDDLGAIVIIAMVFTDDLSTVPLVLAGLAVVTLVVVNLAGCTRLAIYALVGIFLWVCVLKSGVHATLAGIAVGLAVPLRDPADRGEGPLHRLEHSLHPWVAFAILPVFALANAGVSLSGMSAGTLLEPLPLGIALGLFLGKQAGVAAACWLCVRLGVGMLPEGTGARQVYGVAVLTGVGFTMSLFIGTLALADPEYAPLVRLGVLTGSLASALVGYLVLRFTGPPGPRGTKVL
jgi:Na+:H+ antiporter, NhaA family